MTDADPHDLARFLDAQRGVHERAVAELRRGRKASHWMWFVFPQIAGLGYSDTSRRYAVRSLGEAQAYLAHPVLGPRLMEATRAMLGNAGLPARAVLGDVDAQKLHACLTLFAAAAQDADDAAWTLFDDALDAFFDGRPHAPTLALLGSGNG